MIHLLVIFALIGPGFCMAVDFGEDNSYPHVEVPSNGFTCESYSSSLCTSEKNESCASVEEECSLHHGLNLACYALWKNNSKDGVKVRKKMKVSLVKVYFCNFLFVLDAFKRLLAVAARNGTMRR